MHRLLTIAALVLSFGISSAEAAKRVALVIGNDSYKTLPDLNNARTDACGMAAKLKELGWSVILKQYASRRDISRSLADFEGRLKGAEVGLVFYAGHGIQKDGANYLVPSNAQIEVEEALLLESVEADQFLKTMERAGALVLSNALSIQIRIWMGRHEGLPQSKTRLFPAYQLASPQ